MASFHPNFILVFALFVSLMWSIQQLMVCLCMIQVWLTSGQELVLLLVYPLMVVF
jgi:hypothetical protein